MVKLVKYIMVLIMVFGSLTTLKISVKAADNIQIEEDFKQLEETEQSLKIGMALCKFVEGTNPLAFILQINDNFELKWPVDAVRTVISEFGPRQTPTAGASSDHKGIDIAGPIGTPINSSEAGEVEVAEFSSVRGNYVIIDHGNNLKSLYQHLEKIEVNSGDQVGKGELIGELGATGVATGPHLHYEIWINEEPVNPLDYINPQN